MNGENNFSKKRTEKITVYDVLFFLYFVVMFAHSEIPYLKFILFLAIIAYTSINVVKNGFTITGNRTRNLKIIIIWYGILMIYIRISALWAYVNRTESTTLSSMLRIFMISICMGYYLNTFDRVKKILKIFCISCAYFAVVFVMSSPISTWGDIEMGGITGQYRNFAGYICAINVLISFMIYKDSKKRIYELIAAICFVTTVLTGSRGSIISIGVMLALYVLEEKNVSRKIRYLVVLILFAMIALYVLFTNPYLNSLYGERLVAIFSSKATDNGSKADRAYYIQVALQMFKQRPVLGWGDDNFAYYLGRFTGYGREVYSHCNYAEILADFGIIGFVLYYWMYVKLLKNNFKERKNNFFSKLTFIIVIRFIIFEYSSITYAQYLYIYLFVILICGMQVRRDKKYNEYYKRKSSKCQS